MRLLGFVALRSCTHPGQGGQLDLDVRQVCLHYSCGYVQTPCSSLRWRLPKVLFLINRYLVTMLLLCVICYTFPCTCANKVPEQQAGLHP
ncbi:hypothetical protein PILCRDRAFT_701609 [Piloderma croceum F 1598]|uniref:Uncharacterized protein n=1 Tax=Piloderma croceum (strain F 1598) TaxID=765440 RepID=A0A0C3F3C2_PILCF|nr:hypothetical protein PILCRDRAFT_701609 [Piloderma croceum F 1598]